MNTLEMILIGLLSSPANAQEYNEFMFSRNPSFFLEKYTSGKSEVESLAKSLVGSNDSIYKKIEKIYGYVVKNTKYVDDPVDVDLVKTARETLDNGGDCEDLTLLMISLLENVDVNTYFVEGRLHIALLAGPVSYEEIYSRRKWGLIEYYTIPNVEGKYLFLESTSKGYTYPGDPGSVVIDRGLVVDSDSYEIVGRIGVRPFRVMDYKIWRTDEQFYAKKEKIGGH